MHLLEPVSINTNRHTLFFVALERSWKMRSARAHFYDSMNKSRKSTFFGALGKHEFMYEGYD
jgi:hypothetical protein